MTALLPHIVHSVEKAEKGKKMIAELTAKKEKEEADRKKAAEMPDLIRRDSDAASDMTLIVEPRREVPFTKDIDCQSMSSVSSSTSTSSSSSG